VALKERKPETKRFKSVIVFKNLIVN